MSSFAFKCVLYCPERNAKGTDLMELNFEGLEIPKCNVPIDRVDAK